MLGKLSADNILKYFSYFSYKIVFAISCKYFHQMSLQIFSSNVISYFLGKIRKTSSVSHQLNFNMVFCKGAHFFERSIQGKEIDLSQVISDQSASHM